MEEVQEAVVENVEETTEEVKVDVNDLAKQVEELKKLQAGSDRAYAEAAKKAKALEIENEKLKTEKMSAEEKAKFEIEKQARELEEKDREFKSERANFTKIKVVGTEGLPMETADFIKGETEEEIKENAVKLKAVLDGYASVKVNEALGTVSKPKAGSEDNDAIPKDLKNITMQEINRLAEKGKLNI